MGSLWSQRHVRYIKISHVPYVDSIYLFVKQLFSTQLTWASAQTYRVYLDYIAQFDDLGWQHMVDIVLVRGCTQMFPIGTTFIVHMGQRLPNDEECCRIRHFH